LRVIDFESVKPDIRSSFQCPVPQKRRPGPPIFSHLPTQGCAPTLWQSFVEKATWEVGHSRASHRRPLCGTYVHIPHNGRLEYNALCYTVQKIFPSYPPLTQREAPKMRQFAKVNIFCPTLHTSCKIDFAYRYAVWWIF